MRPLLKRLFPNLYSAMSEWPVEKWAMLPFAIVLFMTPISGIAQMALFHYGYYDDLLHDRYGIEHASQGWEP